MSSHQGAILGHVTIETTDIDGDVAVMTQTLGLTEVRWGVHVLTGKRIAMLVDSTLTTCRQDCPHDCGQDSRRTSGAETRDPASLSHRAAARGPSGLGC